MIEKDTRSLMSRVTDFAFGRWESEQTRRLGGTSSDSVSWLAGDGYRPRQSAASPKPSKMNGKSSVDRLLETKRPADPVKAAAVRMMLLSELWATDSKDPRVVSIFEADPVVVEDWVTQSIITESQLRARIALFDLVTRLFEGDSVEPVESTALRAALTGAFPHISGAARREWALSEVRWEQVQLFVARKSPEDVAALIQELLPVYESKGPWDAIRFFTHGSTLLQPAPMRFLPIVGLLDPLKS